MSKESRLIYVLILFIVSSCASYKPQFSNGRGIDDSPLLQNQASEINGPRQNEANKPTIDKTFYLIGDAGGAEQNRSTEALLALEKVLDTAVSKDAYTLFLGVEI